MWAHNLSMIDFIIKDFWKAFINKSRVDAESTYLKIMTFIRDQIKPPSEMRRKVQICRW